MSFQIKGLDNMLKELEQRLGPTQTLAVRDAALKAGAAQFKKELVSQLETFKDTGATIDELQFSDPQWDNGVRVIKVYWKGPNNRYAIIHLNEFGTIKNPNPRGKGKIALALKNSEKAYRDAVRKVLKNI